MSTHGAFGCRVRSAAKRVAWAACTALGVLSATSSLGNAADSDCPAAPRFSRLRLPHLRAALNDNTPIVIVALGSSSTEGIAASDKAHSYPAVLQASLDGALPRVHPVVINRGVGGQDAPEELARLDSDVIALHPQLVIWQVGANGAMRGAKPEVFHAMVAEGVNRLHAAGIDVVLMDNQRAPRVDSAPGHGTLDAELAKVAAETGAGLFSRGALMDAWAAEGAPHTQFISADGLHHNDRGYACVARTLASHLLEGLHRAPSLTASR